MHQTPHSCSVLAPVYSQWASGWRPVPQGTPGTRQHANIVAWRPAGLAHPRVWRRVCCVTCYNTLGPQHCGPAPYCHNTGTKPPHAWLPGRLSLVKQGTGAAHTPQHHTKHTHHTRTRTRTPWRVKAGAAGSWHTDWEEDEAGYHSLFGVRMFVQRCSREAVPMRGPPAIAAIMKVSAGIQGADHSYLGEWSLLSHS